MTAAPSDVLEVALLLKEVGLLVPGEEPTLRAQHHPAVRDHRGPAARRHRPRPAVLDHLLPQAAREPRRHAGGDARLLGQQQGRRLPDVELGAVQGRAVDRARCAGGTRSACACFTAAAAPSGAAAARATAPCSRSRRGSVNGQLRLTEQGEVIASKYADPIVGRRNLGTLVAATMEATLLDGVDLGDDEAPFHEAMEELSAHAFAAYRGLVYQTPGFIDYFRASTPINEIGDLNIGSRPAARRSSDRIEDLRAIPWVFSWGQSRQAIPGFYGFGTAVKQYLAKGNATRKRRLATLRAMYARWPFFRTLVDRLDMVLAKMDMGIAVALRGAGPRSQAAQDGVRSHPARARRHARGLLRDHRRRRRCWRTTRRWRAACATASPTSIRSATCRSICCAGCVRAGRRRGAAPRRAPDDQRRRGRPAQQRVARARSLRVPSRR